MFYSEKSASIHKSKYNTLLEHERKRLNRNEELLGMLEDVHAKANAMATNTERLKKLKVCKLHFELEIIQTVEFFVWNL